MGKSSGTQSAQSEQFERPFSMTLNNGLYMISLEAWQIAAMGETLEQFFLF